MVIDFNLNVRCSATCFTGTDFSVVDQDDLLRWVLFGETVGRGDTGFEIERR